MSVVAVAGLPACKEKHLPVPDGGDGGEVRVFPKVIAHRGYHTTVPAVPHNSVASFRHALNGGVYAAEADFYVTADDVVVSYHDTTIPDMSKTIDRCAYSELEGFRLSNGERLPLLADYITAMASDKKTKLIVEIKTHSTAERNNRAADLIIEAVKAAGLASRVEYIAFDYNLCKYLAAHPDIPAGTTIGYLNGDKAPATVHADGINCIDYNQGPLRAHPEWIEQAHDLGMAVNVWTVNDEAAMKEFVLVGVDFITTDYPQTLKALYLNL
jgi:glycerophosphoryl diester phosphodiesterase